MAMESGHTKSCPSDDKSLVLTPSGSVCVAVDGEALSLCKALSSPIAHEEAGYGGVPALVDMCETTSADTGRAGDDSGRIECTALTRVKDLGGLHNHDSAIMSLNTVCESESDHVTDAHLYHGLDAEVMSLVGHDTCYGPTGFGAHVSYNHECSYTDGACNIPESACVHA